MIVPILSQPDSNRRSLQAWAASLLRLQSEAVPVRRVNLDSAPQPATMQTPQVAKLDYSAGLHIVTCRCSLCSSKDLSTSGSAFGGASVVEVKLSGQLSEEEKRMVDRLRQRDAEVRRHEQSHIAAAGPHALGGPSYTYQIGPDGQRYAIGGEVQIDLSPVPDDPEATYQKAQKLRQAALAPSNPSATDRQVAMMASRMAQEALQTMTEADTSDKDDPTNSEQKQRDPDDQPSVNLYI